MSLLRQTEREIADSMKAKLKKENVVYECRLKVTVIQHISADCSFSILTPD